MGKLAKFVLEYRSHGFRAFASVGTCVLACFSLHGVVPADKNIIVAPDAKPYVTIAIVGWVIVFLAVRLFFFSIPFSRCHVNWVEVQSIANGKINLIQGFATFPHALLAAYRRYQRRWIDSRPYFWLQVFWIPAFVLMIVPHIMILKINYSDAACNSSPDGKAAGERSNQTCFKALSFPLVLNGCFLVISGFMMYV
jgi:hypothetical protein